MQYDNMCAIIDNSESGLELHVSPTSHSIHFDCKISKPETIRGCSVIVHAQSSFQGLILTVNNLANNDTAHSLEVKVQNVTELYYYAVFPITSEGITGSNAIKGSIVLRVSNYGKNTN